MTVLARVSELLDSQQINLFIGYTQKGSICPLFLKESDQVDKLIFNEDCLQNLVPYLNKHEVQSFGKIGIFCTFSALRSLLQLKSEKRFSNLSIIPFLVISDDEFVEFGSYEEIESYIEKNFKKGDDNVQEMIDKINLMSTEEKWEFWTNELTGCIKCYACRSACPMCYCDKCSVEINNPQWVPTASHSQGNLEWHVMRAMHLAGRCVNCNECFRACPMDIPLNLLTSKINADMEVAFGQIPGTKLKLDYAMSCYKFDDKDNFIR